MCLENFVRYSNSSNMMEGRMFIKLCKESRLIDSNLTSANCDIAYAQAVKRGQKFLDYEGFINALEEISFIKGITLESVIDQVRSSTGPTYISISSNRPNRLYDDKTRYTGIHSKRLNIPTNFN